MNITFFIGGLSGGGAERVTCNLSNFLIERGHDVSILTMADDAPTYNLDKRIKRQSLIIQKERHGFLYNGILRLWRFYSYLRRHITDIYIVMLPATTIMLLQIRRFTKAKMIASERNIPMSYPKLQQYWLKRLAHNADGWVFQTEEERLWYGETVRKAKLTTIANAINPDFVKPVFEGKRRPSIVTAGRMTKQKNQELLLKAFSTLACKFPYVGIEIYGEGSEEGRLRNVIKEHGLEGRVKLCGYTCNLGDKIKDISLFVLSSDYEGMPNALMEAMALGLPCISTDCDGGGAKFLIENEKNGLLVPKGDVDALAKAMERMLSDRDFAERCGREAHKICERLAPEKIYGEWETFIQNVIAG